ncbi:MAG: hypothetical protein JOZ21_07305 [Verrucomicrobia bacterium]|nr:hypothetical protein [Verrucomicrobiota bacterium]
MEFVRSAFVSHGFGNHMVGKLFGAPHSMEQLFGKARDRRALDAAIQSMIAAAGTRKAGPQGF